MALTKKPAQQTHVALIGDYTEMPDFPEDFLERFPSMKEYVAGQEKWWKDLKMQLQRDRGIIQDALNKLTPRD